MTRTLLIDADIIAYQCSASNEQRIDWGDGIHSHTADFEAAKVAARETIDHLVKKLKADTAIVCLSDDFENFRKDVYPLYKQSRGATVRPEHLYDLKEWLGQEYRTETRPRMEADDVMGILATEPHEGERIIVSQDKDMMTVPCKLYRPQWAELGVLTITPLDAIRFLFWQAIVGDCTDGYPGAKGVGSKSEFAVDVLEAEDEIEAWDHVLDAYASKGLTEADAIAQVYCARILKHCDVSGNTVLPWLPPYSEDEGAN